jgi:hypothetical protein
MESMAAVLEDAEQQSVKNKPVRLRLKDAALDMMDGYCKGACSRNSYKQLQNW